MVKFFKNIYTYYPHSIVYFVNLFNNEGLKWARMSYKRILFKFSIPNFRLITRMFTTFFECDVTWYSSYLNANESVATIVVNSSFCAIP